MQKTKILFHNQSELLTQAQIFTGHTLDGTFIAKPGETCAMTTQLTRYDIFLRNGVTGREIARKLDIDLKSLTLKKELNGWYVITES